jgi:hypothetical protein
MTSGFSSSQTQDAENILELTNHRLTAELSQFRGTIINGDPKAAFESGKVDINDIKFPVILQDVLIFKTGNYNNLNYIRDQLASTYMRAEGKPLIQDHVKETARQIGFIKNVRWVNETEQVRGDIYLLAELPVRLICMGAKWGLSPTYTYLTGAKPKTVYDPDYSEISIVFDPACRKTMLNSLKIINNIKMPSAENLEIPEDVLKAMLESADISDELKAELKKKMKPKKAGTPPYEYPEAKMQAMENAIQEIRNLVLKPAKEKEAAENQKVRDDLKTANEKIASLEKQVTEVTGQLKTSNDALKTFTDKEAKNEVAALVTMELESGLIEKDATDKRTTEIAAMNSAERKAMFSAYQKVQNVFQEEAKNAAKKLPGKKSQPSAGRQIAKNDEQQEQVPEKSIEEEMFEMCQRSQLSDGKIGGDL